MSTARRLRVLLLAEQCNPEWPSLPIVGYKYAVALSEVCDVTVATQVRNVENIEKRHPTPTPGLTFDFIDTEYVARPLHRAAELLRGDPEIGWSTNMAMAYLPYVEFERQAWRRYRARLAANQFDVVHRITPMSPALPSWMAGRAGQPFVIGPLNGNLAWPRAFATEQKREKERLRAIRDAYKVLPFSRRTWKRADLVLAAFQHTVDDLPAVPPDRLVMMPEVGFDESIFHPPSWLDPVRGSSPGTTSRPEGLTFLYAGRLVPYKLPEVAVRAFIDSGARAHGHRLRVVGDGPERPRLEQIVADHGAGDLVTLEGKLDQAGVARAMRESDVFVFPSIRELGAGVVVEAMACGLLCLVVDYGGPADLVATGRGVKVPLGDLDELTAAFRREIDVCVAAHNSEAQLASRRAAVQHAFGEFTWHTKATLTEGLYRRLLRTV